MTEFNELISSERRKRGYSLRQASAIIGISHTYLDALEKGRDPRTGEKPEPSQDVVFKICKAYNIDFSQAAPFLQIHDEYGFYLWMARNIRSMKKTKPLRYRELKEIIDGQ